MLAVATAAAAAADDDDDVVVVVVVLIIPLLSSRENRQTAKNSHGQQASDPGPKSEMDFTQCSQTGQHSNRLYGEGQGQHVALLRTGVRILLWCLSVCNTLSREQYMHSKKNHKKLFSSVTRLAKSGDRNLGLHTDNPLLYPHGHRICPTRSG